MARGGQWGRRRGRECVSESCGGGGGSWWVKADGRAQRKERGGVGSGVVTLAGSPAVCWSEAAADV